MSRPPASTVEVAIVHAFTLAPSPDPSLALLNPGGNRAGVVLDAGGLTPARMQQIATRMALSETAFLVDATESACRVRFFTPAAEIDFCGHALLAGFAIASRGKNGDPKTMRMSMTTAAGPVTLQRHPDGMIFMNQSPPTFSGGLDRQPIADLLRLPEAAIASTGLPVEMVSTGLPDIMVPVIDRSALAAISPDFAALARYSERTGTVGVHAFTLDADGVTAHCRNFAPRYGINEESATGSSSGALACYLTRHLDRFGGRYLFEQGTAMGLPARIAATTTKQGEIIAGVEVGGFVALGKPVLLGS